MKVKPVLGGWEIPNIEYIGTAERRFFAELPIPGRAGSLYQDMNSAPTRVLVTGSLFGDENRNSFLEEVRGKFQAGEPVTFIADIVTATEVQYVIIEALRFQESGNRPDQMDYRIVLRESPPPPPLPDPLGALDTSLLDQAASAIDSVTGALDAIDMLSNIPDIGNPTEPLTGMLDGVEAATSDLGSVANDLKSLFG